MIEKLAGNMAHYFCRQGSYSDTRVEEYSYGFQLLISTAVNTLFIILISIFLRVFVETLFFMAAFVSLRITADGYHAKSHKVCIILICVVYTSLAATVLLLPENVLTFYSLASIAVAAIIVWMYSPVEVKNKPLGPKQRRRLREQSILVITVLMTIAALGYFFPALSPKLIAFGMSGALAASVSALITAKLNEKGDGKNE